MPRYALLLRGVNVGTKNSLPMAELRSMLDELGCTDVATYVQSGNAVFATKLAAATLTKKIEVKLAAYMGRPIATTLRTRAELEAVVKRNPLGKVAKDPSRSCVTFLSHEPKAKEIEPLTSVDFEPDVFRVVGREIYSWHPNGQGKSKLAAAIAKLKIEGAVTTRNWNTVQKLCAMLDDG